MSTDIKILVFFDYEVIFFIRFCDGIIFKSISVKIENYAETEFNPDNFRYDEIFLGRFNFFKDNIEHYEVQDVSTEYILNMFPEKFI